MTAPRQCSPAAAAAAHCCCCCCAAGPPCRRCFSASTSLSMRSTSAAAGWGQARDGVRADAFQKARELMHVKRQQSGACVQPPLSQHALCLCTGVSSSHFCTAAEHCSPRNTSGRVLSMHPPARGISTSCLHTLPSTTGPQQLDYDWQPAPTGIGHLLQPLAHHRLLILLQLLDVRHLLRQCGSQAGGGRSGTLRMLLQLLPVRYCSVVGRKGRRVLQHRGQHSAAERCRCRINGTSPSPAAPAA